MRYRGWCFTINNWKKKEEKLLEKTKCKYLVVGKEAGSKKMTKHLQGYIYFTNKKTFDQMKKLLPRAHLEIAKGNAEQNRKYCIKENNFWEKGSMPMQGKRTDLTDLAENIMKKDFNMRDYIIENQPNYQQIKVAEKYLEYIQIDENAYEAKTVYWFYGKTGCGKTRKAMEIAKGKSMWISGRDLKWWNGYTDQEVVIIDDFRRDFCTFHELLRILDGYPYTIEVKGGSRKLVAKTIILTSPKPWWNLWEGRSTEDLGQLDRRITKTENLTKIEA